MLVRLSVAILALPLLALAEGSCNTENQQCCDSLQSTHDSSVASLLGLLGIPIQGVAVPIGLTCVPISVLAITGQSCNQQTVCCANNNFNGIVALGCTPINLNL